MPSKHGRAQPTQETPFQNPDYYDNFIERLINALEYISREAKAANLNSVSAVIDDAVEKSLEAYVTQKQQELAMALQGQSPDPKSSLN